MQFSGADVIVLAVVIITLAVYRHLDRNNRSLDKVKKLADRVHDELEAHVQAKIVSIKDMGIEIEVHQKAAREVLKRVQGIESGLNSRSEEIERIGARIGEYDAALNELVTMTARAQENISRIRDESAYVDGVGKRIRVSQERIALVEKRIDEATETFRRENEVRLEAVEQAAFAHARDHARSLGEELSGFQERVNQFEEYVRGTEERANGVADRTREEIEEIVQTALHRAEEATIQSSEQMAEIKDEFEALQTGYQKRLLELAERGEKMETEALVALRQQIDGAAQEVTRELNARLDNHKRAMLERVQTALAEMERAQTELSAREQQMQAARADLDRRIEEFGSELRGSIEARAIQLQRDVLGEIEQHLGEYEGQIAYRFEKLTDIGEEVGQLEGRLRESIEQVTSRVRAEFEQHLRNFRESRDQERRSAEADMAAVREQVSDVETALTDLKNSAYENVNEKLQVFEDEFFADLRERQVSMEQRLVDWQGAFQQELDQVAASAAEERTSMEQSYSSELKQRLEDLKRTTYGTYEKIQEEIVGFQRGIELRVSDSRELLSSLEREIEQEIQQLAADSRSGLREQFAGHRDQMAGELHELERSLRQQVDELKRHFTGGRAELEAILESSRSDATLWKGEIDQQLSLTTAEVREQIADFRVDFSQTIAEIREAAAAERDEALRISSEQRERLQADLDELGSRVSRLTEEIGTRSSEALAEFGERYSDLKLDAERQVKAMNADVDARHRDFRGFVQDTRDQFNATQERLLGKLGQEAQALAANLAEIDKRQRSFIEQTKVFERADAMRDELQTGITSLKAEMERVEQRRREIREIEAQFGRLRKSADEVTDKLNRFVTEKRKIDSLEEDYKRLLSMSQAVELKLEHVTASHDTIQAMQVSLRTLGDLEKEVETRFQRLEKKRSILDMTTEGVDKNFQEMQEMERRLGEVAAQVNNLPERIEELGARLQQLGANKRDADAAVKQLALLDNTLEEIEARMENLNQAREWLARTETRFEEVEREAEEQVRLLGALLKQEGRDAKKTPGAPPVTTRDTVIKLVRQSWNVDEIARATSLSRGEVELILELATK